jgi:hypothetical protein
MSGVAANMNVLYKYCDQLGVVKIMGSLELKLPYISEVNDPLECLPFFYCPNDKSAMKEQCLCAFKRNNINPPTNWEQKLDEQIKTGEFQGNLKKGLREHLYELRQKSFLLSVSRNASSTVIWAHYADKHKGAIIGIDFDKIFPKFGIKMHQVTYSENRPTINILDDFYSKEFFEKYDNTLLTKSNEWVYEEEFRCIFGDDYLMGLKKEGFASLKDFNGQKTWFLRLNPESIREIILGLYTEESLKLAIRKLIERPELQHVKLYQTEESETYALNLVDIKSKIQ